VRWTIAKEYPVIYAKAQQQDDDDYAEKLVLSGSNRRPMTRI